MAAEEFHSVVIVKFSALRVHHQVTIIHPELSSFVVTVLSAINTFQLPYANTAFACFQLVFIDTLCNHSCQFVDIAAALVQ
jgi:hypothetical protein